MSSRTAPRIPTLRSVLTALILGSLVLAGTTLTAALPAQAAARDGICQKGEFCYYYNSNNKGSISDFTTSVGDYGTDQPSCYDYKGRGAGKGRCIKNDAASVWNRTGKTVRVHYNSNYAGTSQKFTPGAKKNLNARHKNNNASHKIGGGSTPTGCKTDGTNKRLPSTILVYRVDLNRVDRVNFKSYVKNVLPNEWFSSWPTASLKAGAMATKNFGWYWALKSQRDTPWGECYDVRDDEQSQVYNPSSAKASTNAAVDATWNKRMVRDGAIFQAHYCSRRNVCGAWVNGDWMSQYGSRDQANTGKGYRQILNRYYDDIRIL